MVRLVGKQGEKCHLRAPIAFAKWMDRVQRRKEYGRLVCECIGRETAKIAPGLQVAEQRAHLSMDVLRIAEGAPALTEPNGAEPSGPGEYVLEQVAMNGTIVGGGKAARRKWLVGPLSRGCCLEGVELILRPETWDIPEHRRARIAVWILNGLVHAVAS